MLLLTALMCEELTVSTSYHTTSVADTIIASFVFMDHYCKFVNNCLSILVNKVYLNLVCF